ncbi:MAG TPA: hypothetical protein VHE35_05635 [Kofleriaceae bacterium]|nr:hypothetical protein [Kofleriaceae bacterium]
MSQHEPRVERFVRLASGASEYQDVATGSLELACGATLDLARLHDGLPP